MQRFILLSLALYGLLLSRRASSNINDLARRAAAGDQAARHHFTQTRYARVFGPKNSDLGMIYYTAVAIAALTGLHRWRLVRKSLFAASSATVLLSLYLLWALLFRLRTRCDICLQVHAVNLATALVLASGSTKRSR